MRITLMMVIVVDMLDITQVERDQGCHQFEVNGAT